MTRQDAYTQFAVWLSRFHPALFAQLRATSASLKGLGRIYRGSYARRASQAFGDYADYLSDFSSATDDVSVDIPEIDIPADFGSDSLISSLDTGLSSDIADETSGAATLSEEVSAGAAPTVSIPTMAAAVPTAAAATVGQTLASNAGLITATLNAANTVVSSNAAAAVIQAQAQRAAAGLAPANVGYETVTDPTTGLVSTIPVLNGAGGSLPLTTAGINALSPATFLQNYGLYIMLGLAALVVAME